MRLAQLISLAADAALDAERATTRATRLRAAAIAEAERIRLTSGDDAGKEWGDDSGLGVLNVYGVGPLAFATATVVKAEEFGSWLAERDPERVTATLTVPAGRLGAAVEALDFAGITGAHATVTPNQHAGAFLADKCVVQADPDAPGAWNVLHVDDLGHTEPVPGVVGVKPPVRWVLTLTKGLKAQAAIEARTAAEADLEHLLDDTAGDVVDPDAVQVTATPPGLADDFVDVFHGLTLRELASKCRDAGIPSSGSKHVLEDRLVAHLRAQQTASA